MAEQDDIAGATPAPGENGHGARGERTGIGLPVDPAALLAGGPAFLTQAFRAFGALDRDNSVVAIRGAAICHGGSTGKKLMLSADYLRDAPALPGELFVKFSRALDDPVRDARGKYEMAGEVRLAVLARLPGFPVALPQVCFADLDPATQTGLLVTERIAFGEGGIAVQHVKCRDDLLADPVSHYAVVIETLAALAAAHRSGRLGDAVEALLPYDPAAAAAQLHIAAPLDELLRQIATLRGFVAAAPQLFPPSLHDPALFDSLAAGAQALHPQQRMIADQLTRSGEAVALCHWNANLDNAWFWRDSAGALRCGLMDWGHAGQMNVAFALWGSMSGATAAFWRDDADRLVALFRDRLAEGGGPRLSREQLQADLDSYIAFMGLSYLVVAPARILAAVPDAAQASGPSDMRIADHERARNQLSVLTAFLTRWQARDIGGRLRRLLA